MHRYEEELERVKSDQVELMKFAETMMHEAIDMNCLFRDMTRILSDSLSNCDALRAANAELREALAALAKEDSK